jgi:hypothetical protein
MPRSDLDLERLRLPATQDLHRQGFTDRITGQARKEPIVVLNRLTVDSRQNVADDQPAGFSGTAVLHADHQQAGSLLTLKGFLHRSGELHALAAYAEITALNRAVFGKLVGHFPGIVRGESQHDAAPEAGGVQPDHAAFRVHQRPARKTGERCCVGADEAVDAALRRADRAARGADHAQTDLDPRGVVGRAPAPARRFSPRRKFRPLSTAERRTAKLSRVAWPLRRLRAVRQDDGDALLLLDDVVAVSTSRR